jgi:hypothetical protein
MATPSVIAPRPYKRQADIQQTMKRFSDLAKWGSGLPLPHFASGE